MPKEYTFTPKFKLIVDHLKAVRTLDDYINGVGLKKDMQALSNHLQQDVSGSVLHPAGWEELYARGGFLYASPKSKSKWRVVRGDSIQIQIYLAWPVQDPGKDEPHVGLYVPENWKKRVPFIDKLKAPPGFEHFRDCPVGEVTADTTIFKYVPYIDYIGAEEIFDSTGFIAAFGEATKALVDMEKDIDEILDGLA